VTIERPYVAVVDDEAPVRVALGRLLRLNDYDIGSFRSGEEFLASLETRRPACVILDIQLSGISGLEVQTRMRAAGEDIPVVFITANQYLELTPAASEAGGVRLLRKPFANAALLDAIGAALERRS